MATYRVIHLPADTKQAAQTARDNTGQTMRAWLTEATEARLPGLVESLRALGFGESDGERKAARWAFDEETLLALATASEETGLPQVTLLSLLVRAAAAEQQPATPKAKTKASKTAAEKPTRQKRVAEQKPAKAAPRKRKGTK